MGLTGQAFFAVAWCPVPCVAFLHEVRRKSGRVLGCAVGRCVAVPGYAPVNEEHVETDNNRHWEWAGYDGIRALCGP